MKKKMYTSYVWIYILLVLCRCFFVSESFAQDVTLRYGHVQGTSLTYALTLDTPSLQASQTVHVDIIRDVVNVDPQEVMEINTTLSNGEVIVNGISYPLTLQGHILTAMITRRGEAVATTATGELGNLFTQAGIGLSSTSPDVFRSLGILEFPELPVSTGSIWAVDKNHSFPNGDSLDITYAYTLEGFVNYAGYQCAQISIDAQPLFSIYQDAPTLRLGTQINGRLHFSGVLLFAYNEGKIIKLDEFIETDSIGITVGYDGKATIVPVYQKTLITLELQ